MKIHTKTFLFTTFYKWQYVTICEDLKYAKINSVNPLNLVISKLNRYFEEINGNKYLTLVLTNESK